MGLFDIFDAKEQQRAQQVTQPPRQLLPAHIRWMIRRDMPEVLDIENRAFEFPWSEHDFYRCFRQRNCIGMVAEDPSGEQVIGFMVYELHKSRLHILNFAVRAEYQRRGVGAQMAAKLTSKLSRQRRTQILLEIRETNLPAQLFFSRLGFRAVGVLRDFYEDTTEDAYLFEYRFTDRDTDPQPVNRISRLF